MLRRHRDRLCLYPRPVQVRIPLLIGGNGSQVLRLGGRAADIVSLTADEFRLRSHNPGDAVEITLVPAETVAATP